MIHRRLTAAGLVALCTMVGVLALGSAAALAAPEAPKIEEASVADVASSSATLEATLNPGGAETTYTFEYAPAGSAFAPVGEQGGSGTLAAGAAGVALSVHVQRGLLAGAAYEFRLVASNSVETVTGEAVPFTMQTAGGAFVLPDGRQYELVTPPRKQGVLFEPLETGNVIQASASGNAIVDIASAPTEAEPQGYALFKVSVLSTRGASGWSSQVITPPYPTATDGETEDGEYRLFSQDLSRAVLQPLGDFDPLLSPAATEATAYLRNNAGCEPTASERVPATCYTPLVTQSDDTAEPFRPFGEETATGCFYPSCGPEYVAASPDLSAVILASEVQLTATPAPNGGLYEWSGGQLQLISVLPGAEEGSSGLLLPSNNDTGRGGPNGGPTGGGRREVSDDGERVVMYGEGEHGAYSERGGLYLREVASRTTVQLDLPEPGCGVCGPGGGGRYMTASSDGSRIFFLAGERLTSDSSTSGADLYEYDVNAPVGSRLRDLTVDPHAGGSAYVSMVLGASEDGSYVYFTAGGALAPGATLNGPCHQPGESPGPCNLYAWHEGVTRFIGELSATDEQLWKTGSTLADQHARVSPNGRWLAFMSDRDLAGYDTRDALTGGLDEEVYLYDASSNRLACVSCDPTGARPVGSGGVPGWTVTLHRIRYAQGYQPRYLSNGGRLFFDSADPLVPQDVNGAENVYEYEPEGEHCSSSSVSGSEVFKPARDFEVEGVEGEEGAGCVGLISAGTSGDGSSFLEASESGGDVFFLTTSRLVPEDVEGGFSVFDAHECTGAAPCFAAPAVLPPACDTESSCKAAPTPPPAVYGAPASATFTGAGNIAPPPAPAAVKPKAKARRCAGHGKLERGKCVKAKRHVRGRAGRARKAIRSTKSSRGGRS